MLPGKTCSTLLFSDFLEKKTLALLRKTVFLLVWDKDSYTERLLALLPRTCVLQPTLIHLYQTSSIFLSLLPIVAFASLKLLYLLLYSEHLNHIQVLDFLPFTYSSHVHPPLVCDPCPIILLHLL
jgi:hypothetical protein